MISVDLPLADLHRHLDGCVRLQTILGLGLKYNLNLPASTLDGLKPYVQVMTPQPGVMAFIEKFFWMTAVMVDYEAIERIALECVEDLQQEGIDYAELRFSPMFMAEAHQLNLSEVIRAVNSGIQAGKNKTHVNVNLIGIISRTYGPEQAWKELQAILASRQMFCGVDLAGDEFNYPGEEFVPHFKAVRDAGLHVTVHAGESRGPESVWQALTQLGAERIGHAVHAIEDPVLMDYLANNKIGIESNLTSNVQTSTVSSYKTHPLKTFLQYGIPATINTDDPGISAIDLPYEYNFAASAASCDSTQIRQAQINGILTAFMSESEKNKLIQTHQAKQNQS